MLSEKTIQNLKSAQTIALCVSEINNLDRLYSLVALYDLLEASGKKVTVYTSHEPIGRFKELLEKEEMNLITKVEPVKYIISIDYSKTPIEKVSYDNDEKTGRINFYITPVGREFDFDNVVYDKAGSEFDQVIVIGCKAFDEMGEIYKANSAMFKKSKTIVINRRFDSDVENFVKVTKDSSFAATILKFAKDCEFEITEEVAQELMTGVVDYSNVLEAVKATFPWTLC